MLKAFNHVILQPFILLALLMFATIFLSIRADEISVDDKLKWLHIEMPTQSLFAGFEPPNDKIRWTNAIQHAINGTQLLLRKVQQQINSYEEVLKGIK